MSGEAAWMVTSKLFTMALLSGQPVWTLQEAAPLEQRLESTFAPRIPAVASAAVRVGPPSQGGRRFNLRFNVTARPRRTQLDALAIAIARILFPDCLPEDLIIT